MRRTPLGDPIRATRRVLAAALALAALLPLTAAAASATAGATDAAAAEAEAYGIALARDVPVTMADGRILRADIRTPVDPATGAPASGPFPVILQLTPYGKSRTGGANDHLVRHGYISVSVDVAGTGGSEGASQLFGPHEAADSVELIDWVAALPRSNGKVGMTGSSYLAIVQLFAAAAVGPDSPLKAIFPVAASADPYRDLFVSGGVLNVESPAGLVVLYAGLRTVMPLAERGPQDPLDALRLSLEHALQAVPFEVRTAHDVLLDGARRYDGPYWQARAPERVVYDIVANGVAVYLVGGLYDVFQRGEPLLYSALQNVAAGRPAHAPMEPGQPVSGRYQLLFGPWHHGNQGAGADLGQLELRWFDHWLKGRDTGIADTATPLHVIEPGGARYDVAAYPPETSHVERLHLGPAGRLDPAAPGAAGSDTVLFTGLSNPCSRSTQQWSAGLIPADICGDQRRDPGPDPGGVAYTTAPLTEPLTLAGPIGVTLHASATTSETLWTVTVEDVAPDGAARQVTAGAQLGSLRALDEQRSWPGASGGWVLPYHPLTRGSRQPVVPGAITRYDIEVRPAFATLAPGHRLRVTIGTGDLPHLAPNPAELVNLLGGVYTLHRGASAPSWIDLTVADPRSTG